MTVMRDMPTRRDIHAAVLAAVLAGGCASAPPTPASAPKIPFEQKMAWMLQLEDRRILRVELPPAPPPVAAPRRRGAAPVTAPAIAPDLAVLVTDSEPRIRRRAATAIGRVGLRAGIPLLTTALGDTDPEVREMAAFGLGLIADASAAPPLTAALADASPVVRGRAAEALGQIAMKQPPQFDDAARKSAADAIGRVAAEYARVRRWSSRWHQTTTAGPPRRKRRRSVSPSMRWSGCGRTSQLSAAVLDPSGQRVTRWWPAAYALGRIEDQRAQPALLAYSQAPGKYSIAFAARGLGAIKDPAAVEPLIAARQRSADTGRGRGVCRPGARVDRRCSSR